jgi:hypothetical protein
MSALYEKLLAEAREDRQRLRHAGRPAPRREIIHPSVPDDLAELPLYRIARLISEDWPKPYYGAVPYLMAMYELQDISEWYGHDCGASIVRYFLVNANTWRGPVARAVKADLKRRLKG